MKTFAKSLLFLTLCLTLLTACTAEHIRQKTDQLGRDWRVINHVQIKRTGFAAWPNKASYYVAWGLTEAAEPWQQQLSQLLSQSLAQRVAWVVPARLSQSHGEALLSAQDSGADFLLFATLVRWHNGDSEDPQIKTDERGILVADCTEAEDCDYSRDQIGIKLVLVDTGSAQPLDLVQVYAEGGLWSLTDDRRLALMQQAVEEMADQLVVSRYH